MPLPSGLVILINQSSNIGLSLDNVKEAVQLSDKLHIFNSKFYQEFHSVNIFCQKLILFNLSRSTGRETSEATGLVSLVSEVNKSFVSPDHMIIKNIFEDKKMLILQLL